MPLVFCCWYLLVQAVGAVSVSQTGRLYQFLRFLGRGKGDLAACGQGIHFLWVRCSLKFLSSLEDLKPPEDPLQRRTQNQEQSRLGGTSGDRLVQLLLKPGLASKLGKADNRPRYYQLGYPKQPSIWARHSLSRWTQCKKGMGSQQPVGYGSWETQAWSLSPTAKLISASTRLSFGKSSSASYLGILYFI